MTIADTLIAIAATEIERLQRLAHIGDFATAGPDSGHDFAETPHPPHPKWQNGWWHEAIATKIHPHRVGGAISACLVLDHSTDMHRRDLQALKNRWATEPGDGAGAHFLVGENESEGVMQMISILRNGNHAGGKTPPNGHGWVVDPAHPGINIHPNLVTIGIEFSCAGGQVRLIDGVWRFVEDGKIHGDPIDASTIEPDPNHPGRGWQVLTEYQQGVRKRLHADLDAVLRPMPAGMHVASTGEKVPSWGVPKSYRFSGHITYDPTNRSDPWPPNMRALL